MKDNDLSDLIEHASHEFDRALNRHYWCHGEWYPSSIKISLQDPYTYVEMNIEDGVLFSKTIFGFAKRSPKDRPDLKRAVSIAVFRAVKNLSKASKVPTQLEWHGNN